MSRRLTGLGKESEITRVRERVGDSRVRERVGD